MAQRIPKFGNGWAIGLTILTVLLIFVVFHNEISEAISNFPYAQVIGLVIFLLAIGLVAGIFSKIFAGDREKFASRWVYVYTISAVALMFIAWWTSGQTEPPFTLLP